MNPVNLVNRVKNTGLSVDSLTNRCTAIDAAAHAGDRSGGLSSRGDRDAVAGRTCRGGIDARGHPPDSLRLHQIPDFNVPDYRREIEKLRTEAAGFS
jgi:hypothetical protein